MPVAIACDRSAAMAASGWVSKTSSRAARRSTVRVGSLSSIAGEGGAVQVLIGGAKAHALDLHRRAAGGEGEGEGDEATGEQTGLAAERCHWAENWQWPIGDQGRRRE